MERILWYVFAGSRGGPTRIRIVEALLERPYNAHQLSQLLHLDYKTVEYNLRILTKHVVTVCETPGAYGALHHPSKNLLAHRGTFDRIVAATRPAPPPPSQNLPAQSGETVK